MPVMIRLCVAILAYTSLAWTAESPSINTLDDPGSFQPPKEKGRVEQVDGKDGKAVQFSFDDSCSGAFATSRISGKPEWDQAAGFSFWVKGDGSTHAGCLQFVWNEDYAQRYSFAFSLSSKEWTKVTVAWSDLIPTLSNADSKPLDPKGDRQPSKLGGMWVGKWWFWRDCAAHSFAIDDLRLEPTNSQPTAWQRRSGISCNRLFYQCLRCNVCLAADFRKRTYADIDGHTRTQLLHLLHNLHDV